MHFWSISSKNSFNFVAHEQSSGIWSLIYLKNYKQNVIASGSWDKTIKFWDIHTKTQLAVFEAHFKMIYGLCNFKMISNEYMVSSGYDNCMKVWKISEDYKFELIYEKSYDSTVRICSFELVNHEILLFCSVTGKGFYVYNVNLY